MNRLTKEQLEYMNGYMPANIHDIFATGGGIHIKPSHEGMFTAYKERTGKTTEEALHSPDPHVRQMANFARNASHWKHQQGGTATGKNDQVMQMIQMFAQYVAQQSGKDPNQVYQELMQQLQQMKPDEQQAAIAQIAEQVQKLQQQPQGQEQVAAQGQEQENPQEQVQEQGQEEQTMEYGGQPQYPFGGAMTSNNFFKADPNLLPDNKFNNTLVNGNMLASPFSPASVLSSIDAAPAQGLALGLNAIGSIFGSAAGYSALTSKLFGKRNNAQGYQNYFQAKDNQVQNKPMPNFNGNPPASTPRANEGIYPNKQNDIWNQFQKQKDPWANWKPSIQTPSAPVTATPQVGPQNIYNPAAPNSGASMNKLNGAPSMQTLGAKSFYAEGGSQLRKAQVGVANITTSAPPAQMEYPIVNYRGPKELNRIHSFTTTVNPDIINIPGEGFSTPTEGMDAYDTTLYNTQQARLLDKLKKYNTPRAVHDRNYINNQIANFRYTKSRYADDPFDEVADAYWKKYEKINSGPDQPMEGLQDPRTPKRNGTPPCLNGNCKKAYGGQLPHAEYGIPPGFVDGMGVGQEGYDYGYSNAQLPIIGPQDVYDPNHPISGASTNILNGNNPAIKIQPGASTINPNSVNANAKTLKNFNPYRVSGDQIAMNAINSANGFNFGLGWFDERKQRKANFEHLANSLSSNDISFVNNPREVHGNYTPNVQGGAPSLQADKYVSPNDYGTGWSKYGGQQNFQSGGQYKVSHEELLQLLRDGAEIDFL